MNTTKRVFKSVSEILCLRCDGAGVLGGTTYKPAICGSCNGHGVVLVKNTPPAFNVEAKEPTAYASIGVKPCA